MDVNLYVTSLLRLKEIQSLMLSFREHINDKVNKTYMMLGLIKRNFKYITILTFILLYNSMVRSHLYGTACLTGLYLLTQLTRLRIDWISFGIIRR